MNKLGANITKSVHELLYIQGFTATLHL